MFASPLHFIGHSRGASVNTEIIQRLGTYYPNILNIHMTTLDPHDQAQDSLNLHFGEAFWLAKAAAGRLGKWLELPAEIVESAVKARGGLFMQWADFNDPEVVRYEKVSFFDNYYQTLANPAKAKVTTVTPNGRFVQGADYNTHLNAYAGFTNDDLYGGPHGRVLSWYAGTMDLSFGEFGHEFGIFDATMSDPIYRSLSEQGSWVTVLGKDWEQYRTNGYPWYPVWANSDDRLIWEGVQQGWYYSHLGGGYPQQGSKGQDETYDNTRYDHANTPQRTKAVPSVFNGDFQSGTQAP